MSAPVIACQILAIVHSTGSGESKVVQAGLKALTRECTWSLVLQFLLEALAADYTQLTSLICNWCERLQNTSALTSQGMLTWGGRHDSEIMDAVLPVQEAQDLEVNSIGAMKDMELGITVLLKDRQVALLRMDKLERRGKSYF
ncbi:hypothetical protein BDR06DRAFT_1072998 [Suillus hirtellus]|nr:hypothetical protein BDR06DRAFT_1072998 [Suillus hirtellus]